MPFVSRIPLPDHLEWSDPDLHDAPIEVDPAVVDWLNRVAGRTGYAIDYGKDGFTVHVSFSEHRIYDMFIDRWGDESTAWGNDEDAELVPAFLPGYNSALLGLSIEFGMAPSRAVYDLDLCAAPPADVLARPGQVPPLLVSGILLDGIMADQRKFGAAGFVVFQDLKEALIGLALGDAGKPARAAYDYEKSLHIFRGMGLDEAGIMAWVDDNVLSSHHTTTPVFVSREQLAQLRDLVPDLGGT